MKAAILLIPVLLVAGCISEDSGLGKIIDALGFEPIDFSFSSFDITEAVRVIDKQVDVDTDVSFAGVTYTTKIDCKVRNAAEEQKTAHVLAGIDAPGSHLSDMRTVILGPKEEQWIMFAFTGVDGRDARTYCEVENLS
ncbi:MAG: hypothetical protein ABH829_02690 [archaeon]